MKEPTTNTSSGNLNTISPSNNIISNSDQSHEFKKENNDTKYDTKDNNVVSLKPTYSKIGMHTHTDNTAENNGTQNQYVIHNKQNQNI